VCSSCKQAATVDRAVIEHPPCAETLWDWVESPDPPTRWGWISTAYVLIGALPHSGRWRGWLAESTGQPHLVEGLDAVTRRLGGLSRRWRFDRMSTVTQPQTGRLQCRLGRSRAMAVEVDTTHARRLTTCARPITHGARARAAQRVAALLTDQASPRSPSANKGWTAPSSSSRRR
jgi:hypothetical protein